MSVALNRFKQAKALEALGSTAPGLPAQARTGRRAAIRGGGKGGKSTSVASVESAS
jgi:hypothetical protein